MFPHLEKSAQRLPNRISADIIRLAPVVEPDHERAVGAGAELSVMKTDFFGKRARLPAFHARRGDRDPIYRAALDRHVTAHFFEALAAEHLASTGNMFKSGELVSVGVLVAVIRILNKRGSRYAQLGEKLKPGKQKAEIIRLEGDVGVEIANDVIGRPFEKDITRIEAVGFGGELAVAVVRHAQQLEPGMLAGIAADDLVRAVG